MIARPFALAVGTVAIERRRRAASIVGSGIDGINPEPRGDGALQSRRQAPDRRVIGVENCSRHDVGADQPIQWHRPPGQMAHPVGHGGPIDIDALSGQNRRLPIERQSIAVLAHGDIGEQARTRSALVDRQVRRRRLEDALAAAAGIFGADMADHLEPRGDLLQHLGRVLAELAELAVDATVAIDLGFVHHDLARQMIRQWLAHGHSAAPMFADGLCCASGGQFGFVLFKILQLQLKLVDLGLQFLGGAAKACALQRLELQPQVLDLERGACQCRVALRQHPAQHRNLFGGIRMRALHDDEDYRRSRLLTQSTMLSTVDRVNLSRIQTAVSGGAVQTGIR